MTMKALWVTALFVFWLISFPMGGFLLKKPEDMFYFLTTHILGLLFIGLFLRGPSFKNFVPLGIGLSAILTAVYPFVQMKEVLMATVGFFSSFASVNMGVFLKKEVSFLDPRSLWILGGVALGNALSFLLGLAPLPDSVKYILLSSLFVSSLMFETETEEVAEGGKFDHVDLLFIFTLYLTGGIMYNAVMPRYTEVATLQPVEVVFYIGAVLLAVFLITRRDGAIRLLKSVTLILIGLAFTLMHLNSPLAIVLSMFLLQTGFGLADVYVLLLLLKYPNPVRAFGLGFATVCISILTGASLGFLNLPQHLISALGTLALIATAVSLSFTRHMLPQIYVEDSDNGMEEFIESCLKKLSRREREVLFLMLKDRSYRQIAEELGLSVSSVREYIRRICSKFNMDREEIINLFRNAKV